MSQASYGSTLGARTDVGALLETLAPLTPGPPTDAHPHSYPGASVHDAAIRLRPPSGPPDPAPLFIASVEVEQHYYGAGAAAPEPLGSAAMRTMRLERRCRDGLKSDRTKTMCLSEIGAEVNRREHETRWAGSTWLERG